MNLLKSRSGDVWKRRGRFVGALAWLWVAAVSAHAATTNEIRIVELQGTVEVSPAGAQTWVLTQTNQLLHPRDRLRTGPNSRVALRWSDQSVVTFGASTELEILAPHEAGAQSGLRLGRGILSFFHRDKPGRIRVITRGAVAGVEGTEFVMAVDDSDRTTLSVINGKVRFGNEHATLVLVNGEAAIADPGQPPARVAGFVANNILQWSFYYPAVLDLADLPLTSDEQHELSESLAAYRSGDLLQALAKHPSNAANSDAKKIYCAALLLSVGDVAEAETLLSGLSATDGSARPQRLASALRELISAVKQQTAAARPAPELATEFLARSYYEQSAAVRGTSLAAALQSAKEAAARSPEFGFAWARVAELEFSFGHTDRAAAALDQALALTPRNAQALALKGFLLAAHNRTGEAMEWFNRAIAADSGLGNAWLGRGLCRIRRGDIQGGREDLLVAAALEPQRAELRSYLAKAYEAENDFPRATKELHLARTLDPQDPTPWLYSALLNQQHNRINEAIRDLEKSQELNNNRSVYRSQLLLDQDQAVRSANLAAIYEDAGMTDVAFREASRAVNYDYANYSAHLFLANSYVKLSDRGLANLRYETATHSEFLIAGLLAPVDAGPVSQTVSQHEYSRLFQRNRLGVVSSTEYLSRGAWTQLGAQYGTFDKFNYSLGAYYRNDPGQRANHDLELRHLVFEVKGELTPQDSILVQVRHLDVAAGNLGQLYDPNATARTFRLQEKQEPNIAIGYHHEWNPGVHTLFLAARLDDRTTFTNRSHPSLVIFRPDDDPDNPGGETSITGVQRFVANELYKNDLEIYSAELQQIWQQNAHSTILGARAQYGEYDTRVGQSLSSLGGIFDFIVGEQDLDTTFKRFSVYGYHQWEVADWLRLIGGLTFDHIQYPENTRTSPVSEKEKTANSFSPKAGFILQPFAGNTVRFAYTRSVAGPSFDQSIRLEPSQIAGFVQSFRSLMPESVTGPNAHAKFETFGLSLEQKFKTGTYIGLSGEILNSETRRITGAYDYYPDQFDFPLPSGTREHLDFSERSLFFTLNQLVGREWSFGGRYRISHAVLDDKFADFPPVILGNVPPKQRLEGILHQANLFAIYNHRCGFFGQGEALWNSQENIGYSGSMPGDDFWHFNAFAGYRFPRRYAEMAVGVLNISDQDYRLNPLNLHHDLPRERTLLVRLRLNF